MGRVRALPSPCFEQALGLACLQQHIQQAVLGGSLHQPRAELAQHAVVEPRVSQIQPKRIFPVDAHAHRFGGLSVREPFRNLHDRDQRQPPGREYGTPSGGKQIGELLIGVDTAQHIAHLEIDVALGHGGARNADGLFWDQAYRRRMQRHGIPSLLVRLLYTPRCPPLLACHEFANGIC
jgi:hypothetical protein